MKKFLFMMCVTLITLCSCSKEDSVFKSPLESFKIDDMNVSYIGTDYSINLPSGTTYNIGYETSNFVNAYIFGNKLNVVVLPNFNASSRKCSIIVIDTQNDNYAIKFNINQEGGSYFNLSISNFDCDYNEHEYTINVDTNVDYNVSTNNKWIHIKSRDNNKVIFTVDKNDEEARSGEIKFSYYLIHGTPKDTYVTVNQNKNPNFNNTTPEEEIITNKEEITYNLYSTGISIGSYFQGSYSAVCNNNTKNDIEILGFEFYVDDKLKIKADDTPTTVKPGDKITYSFNYNGTLTSAYIVWTIKTNEETFTKKFDL